MKILAINGSPRKGWNTHTLLERALEGAQSLGAQTEIVHLYDLNYKGCQSCFLCKARDSKSYGRCCLVDDAASVLRSFASIEGFIIGSPIYFGSLTSQTRGFLERLLFPFMTYTNPVMSLAPIPLRAGLIYTMNCDQQRAAEFGYPQHLLRIEETMLKVFKSVESAWSYDTLQFSDYSKYVADRFDPEKKTQRRATEFKLDCDRAFDLGKWVAGARPPLPRQVARTYPAAGIP